MRYWLPFTLILVANAAISQTPAANFSVPATACVEARFGITESSTDGDAFVWDFCANDIEYHQATDDVITLPGFLGGFGYRLLEDNGNWYGFALSQVGNWFFRLDFGDSPLNTPQIVDIGNPDNQFNQPQGIEFINDEGHWFAFVGHANNTGSVVRLDFGNSLSNVPLAMALGDFGQTGSIVWDMKPVIQGDDRILVLVDRSTDKLVRINYGSSFGNMTDADDIHLITGIPSASNVFGIDIIQSNGNWIVLLTSYFNNSLLKLDFASDLLDDYVSAEQFTFPNAVKQPVTIHGFYEGGNYYAMVGNNDSFYGFSIVGFGDFTTAPQEIQTFLPVLYSAEAIRWQGATYITGLGSSSVLKKLTFENHCGANTPLLDSREPFGIAYETPGPKPISLEVTNHFSGQASAITKVVTVTGDIAPEIAFNFDDNVCTATPVQFSSSGEIGSIADFFWDFGDDIGTSPDVNPAYQYTLTGEFQVRLRVTGTNGCNNESRHQLVMYSPPVAEFHEPQGLLCTNNEFTISNNTTDLFDGFLSYQWLIGGIPASTDRDLVYTFPDTGPQTIKLITTIPGCSDEVEKITSPFLDGPTIDFSFEGKCQSEDVAFSSLITETVTDHTWNFDDGTMVNEIDPQHAFADAGMYSVALTATSANGCNNTRTKLVQVFSKPETEFEALPPPQSCSGQPTPFFDLTPNPIDSELASWSWDFGDPDSPETTDDQDPIHTFAQSGDYVVSLTVTTDEGCAKTVEEEITIHPSPSVNISHTTTCLNQNTAFTAVGDDIDSYYWEVGTSYYETSSFQHTFHVAGEHNVTLTIVGDNDCISFYDNDITVPVPLSPSWSVVNNCTGFEALFTDLTTGVDPVVERFWDFNGEATGAGATATHVFASEGQKNVLLHVTAASGCEYSVAKITEIVAPPVASFSASPLDGAAPLRVQFANTSAEGTSSEWTFGDGNASVEHSPVHVFENIGSYLVQLEVTNEQGCKSSVDRGITTEIPAPDVRVNLVTTTTNPPDGSTRIIVTIENKGNTLIEGLPVKFNISGSSLLIQTVEGPIPPGTMLNIISDFSIPSGTHLPFICVETALDGDLYQDDDRFCAEFTNSLVLMDPYPNPAADQLKVDWISPDDREVDILLTDSFGRRMNYTRLLSQKGLNQVIIDVNHHQSGIYFLTLRSQSTLETRRIVISRQN